MPLFGQIAGSSDSAPAWTSHLVQTIGAFHPLVVHFPIALLLTAAFLELVSLRLKGHSGLRFAIAVNLLVGTVGAVVAATLGWMDAAHIGFEPDLKPVLAWHRWLGTSVAVGSLITVALWFRATRTNKTRGLGIYRTALWLLAVVLGVTGHLGGLLVVQSRREAVWIGFKAVRFFLPARTDELIRGEASQALETLGEVVSVEERAEVLS